LDGSIAAVEALKRFNRMGSLRLGVRHDPPEYKVKSLAPKQLHAKTSVDPPIVGHEG
jgi:hypothetical protein